MLFTTTDSRLTDVEVMKVTTEDQLAEMKVDERTGFLKALEVKKEHTEDAAALHKYRDLHRPETFYTVLCLL